MAIIVRVYLFLLLTNHELELYVSTALIGTLYYLITRLVFGKHKLWQNLISALVIVTIIECIAPIIFNIGTPITFTNIIQHYPIVISMFLIDFFTEESFEIIEEVEEKLEKTKH